MKRFLYVIFVLISLSTTIISAQIQKGSEYIYFYKDTKHAALIVCYFTNDKCYFEDCAWATFIKRPYSWFKKDLSHGQNIRTAYLQSDLSNSSEKTYIWYGTFGQEYHLTFKDNMNTVIDYRQSSPLFYKRIEKENDTQNNDIIYE